MIKYDYSPEFYIQKLKNGEMFSFTRWGDGEWLCLTGKQGRNTDKHEYFPDLSSGLKKALVSNKEYYRATWPEDHGMIKVMLPTILKHVEDEGIEVDWVNANVWERLVLEQDIEPLVRQLESMDFVIVSEPAKRALPLKYKHYIDIPAINCFSEKDRIKEEMVSYVSKNPGCVFGMSASMATNVIVDELYDLIGDKCWMIDFGSLWEPFIGKRTRSHHDFYLKKNI